MPASLANIQAGTPMGANLIADGATFRVWAPRATAVHVRGVFNNFEIREEASLVRQGNDWWGFIPGVQEGNRYKFWVTGEAGPDWKRDPYARELAVPFPGDCLVRALDFPWHNTGFSTPSFHNLVIYQLHVGAFFAPHWPQKAGTFLDVVNKIPHFVELGVTAVQLLPIQEFPGSFSLGYNGVDYFSPEMAFGVEDARLGPYLTSANALLAAKGLAPYTSANLSGAMNQLKALVDLCHAHGLAVIFDLVFNHAGGNFGEESLWFFDRQTGAKQDPPLWWKSCYFSNRTWAGGNVFNFEENGVRQFLIDNARFLLDEYRVDGFRFDEVSVIDRESYNGSGWSFCQALTGTLRHHRPSALVHAEYWNVNPWVIKEQVENGAGFHTTMTDGPRIALRAVLAASSFPGGHALPMASLGNQLGLDYLRDRWRGVNSFENHDLVLRPKDANDHGRMDRLPRLADPSDTRSWFARSRSRVAMGLLLTEPGIPMVFMGQEFLEDKQWSDDLENFSELLLYWDGFKAPNSVMRHFFQFTRELIRLRWLFPALRGEGFRLVHAHDQNRVLAFHRWVPNQGDDVVVIAHLGNEHRYGYRIGFPGGGRWREVFNSDFYDGGANPQVAGNGGGAWADPQPLHGFEFSAALTLPANSLLVLAR